MSVADWNALRRDMTRGAWTRAYNLISTEAGERMNRRVIFAQFPSTIECDKLFMKR